jgi:hypothetical protein
MRRACIEYDWLAYLGLDLDRRGAGLTVYFDQRRVMRLILDYVTTAGRHVIRSNRECATSK